MQHDENRGSQVGWQLARQLSERFDAPT
jgi:hypothetical protein